MSMDSVSSRPRCVADALELGSLADGEPAMDPKVLRTLYRHARNEDGRRVLFTNDATFVRGWINLDSTSAQKLISAFVPLDDADNIKIARKQAQNNLEAAAWNDILGIEEPPIACKVKLHGKRWGLRFQSVERGLRGQERLNEDLPPTSDDRDAAAAACEPPPPASPNPAAANNSSTTTSTATPNTAAVDVLKKAGMPA